LEEVQEMIAKKTPTKKKCQKKRQLRKRQLHSLESCHKKIKEMGLIFLEPINSEILELVSGASQQLGSKIVFIRRPISI
jgi:hypothetical protein